MSTSLFAERAYAAHKTAAERLVQPHSQQWKRLWMRKAPQWKEKEEVRWEVGQTVQYVASEEALWEEEDRRPALNGQLDDPAKLQYEQCSNLNKTQMR